MLKDRLLAIAEHHKLSIRGFEKECDLKRGNISNMSGELGSDKLAKIIAKFPEVNISWLLFGTGETFLQTKCAENVTVSKSNTNSNKNGNKRNVYKTLPFEGIDTNDTIAIPITDVSAAAGGGAFNADHHETNGAIQLPRSMLRRGTHLCVSVDGRSMEPTLQNGSMVVIRHLDRNEWAYLKDSSLYVITDREGSTYIKRITNNLHANGTLILRSDNSDKRRFSNITLDEEELFNIWSVEWCLSSIFPEAYAEVNERLDLMEGDMSEIKSLVRTIARETTKKP